MTTPHRCPQCQTPLPPGTPEGLCPACLLRAGLPSEPDTHAKSSGAAATSDYSPRFQPPTPAELQQHFPDLEIQSLLGQGGMGAVYRARQLKLDRRVALKILPKNAAPEAAFADRFSREAKAMARLSHPHIVGIHDFGEAGNWYYFVMEFVDGVDLRQALRARTIEPRQALNIVSQICDALQYAHDEGIVHRDIKPENILLDQRGRAKIADFGLAKLLGHTSVDRGLTGTNQVMGTVGYMAPEQLEGAKAVDHRADIYALGVVFYELLTGELPMGRFDPPSHKVQIDVRLDEVVLKTLEKEPARRYQQASAVKEEIDRVSQAKDLPAVPPQAKPAGSLNWPAVGLVAVGVLDLLLLFVGIMDLQEKREFSRPQMWLMLVIVGLLFGFAPLVSGLLMLLRKGYELAVLGALLTLLPLVPLGFLTKPSLRITGSFSPRIAVDDATLELVRLPLLAEPIILIVPLAGIAFAVWALLLLFQTDVRGQFTLSVWSVLKWLWANYKQWVQNPNSWALAACIFFLLLAATAPWTIVSELHVQDNAHVRRPMVFWATESPYGMVALALWGLLGLLLLAMGWTNPPRLWQPLAMTAGSLAQLALAWGYSETFRVTYPPETVVLHMQTYLGPGYWVSSFGAFVLLFLAATSWALWQRGRFK